jgi:hypothetical protein
VNFYTDGNRRRQKRRAQVFFHHLLVASMGFSLLTILPPTLAGYLSLIHPNACHKQKGKKARESCREEVFINLSALICK